MKKLLALVALVAMVAVSSVAYGAATGVVAVTGTLGSNLTFDNACADAIAFGAMSADAGEFGTCAFTAYSNSATGSEATVDDTQAAHAGFWNTAASYEWTPMGAADSVLDDACASGCTERFGYRLDSVVAHTVETDAGNSQDFDTLYHNLSTTADTVINNAGPVGGTGAFTLRVGAEADTDTMAGSYASQITVSYVET